MDWDVLRAVTKPITDAEVDAFIAKHYPSPWNSTCELWWNVEIHTLRTLAAQKQKEDRYLTRVVLICVVGAAFGFAIAMYAIFGSN